MVGMARRAQRRRVLPHMSLVRPTIVFCASAKAFRSSSAVALRGFSRVRSLLASRMTSRTTLPTLSGRQATKSEHGSSALS
eukprot:scaffold1282_cov251-Pinguiococcus_pyrenoidosus.AAC.18